MGKKSNNKNASSRNDNNINNDQSSSSLNNSKNSSVPTNLNTNAKLNKNSSLLFDSQFDATNCTDYDEISSLKTDYIDEKCEAFRRIASAEEIEEMSID